MYNLQELNEMEPAKVYEIAESMGMKNASSVENFENVCYYIIDNMAVETAKAEASALGANKKDRRSRQKRDATERTCRQRCRQTCFKETRTQTRSEKGE